LASGRFGRPQAGHVTASSVPHSAQNFRPASLAVPQAEQVTGKGKSSRIASIGAVPFEVNENGGAADTRFW
jgi:hypothetical protein